MKKLLVLVCTLCFAVTGFCQKANQITTLQNQFLKVKIKRTGAELISIQLLKDNLEYLWQGDTITWSDHAIVQFPIIGNLKNNTYTHEGKSYEMMSHGFARISDFDIITQSNTKAVFELKSSAATKELYPFDFRFQIVYELVKNTIQVSYTVHNSDQKELYFSLGYHPGFNCPLKADENMEDYYLEFSHPETVDRLLLKNNLLDGVQEKYLQKEHKIPLQKKLFQEDAIILKDIASTSVSLKNYRNDKSVTLTFGKVPYLGIWSPKKFGDFVCIEPWFGIADAKNASGILQEKKGMLRLDKAQKFEWTCTITIQ